MRAITPIKENTRAKMRLIPSPRKERLKNPPFCEIKLILIISSFLMGLIKKRRKIKESKTTMSAQKSLTFLGNKRQRIEPSKGTKILKIRYVSAILFLQLPSDSLSLLSA